MPQHLVQQRSGAKRDKYISHACSECQRRKVKCSGEALCSNCRTRGANCQYEDVGPRGPKSKRRSHDDFTFVSGEFSSPRKRGKSRSTLRDQLAQLQEKVDELMQGHNPDVLFPSNSPELPHDASIPANSRNFVDSIESHTSPDGVLNTSTCASLLDSYNPPRIFQDSDVFHALSPVSNPIALSSQIDALKKLGCRNNTNKVQLLSVESTTETHLMIQLPEPNTLWARVTVFLAEFGCYFPCLHGDRICRQVSSALTLLGYDEDHTEVFVGDLQCQIVAILFNMLAYAEAVTQSSSTVDNLNPHLGAERYYQGVKLMEYFGKVHGNDLQTTVYHTTATAYLIEMGMLQMAFQSVSRAFQTALCIGLNDQDRWPVNSKDEDIACRQSLWWTIFFLDKRVAQKIGIAYCVRQTECAVREFLVGHGNLGPQTHHEFLQSMILFSQLWAQIWDSFYSPRATTVEQKKEDEEDYAWEQMKLTDTKIILAYRRIPSRLRWRSQNVSEYVGNGDTEREIRRRLLVFLRFAFLRLSIRHKTIRHTEPDRERRRSCISICLAVIESLRTYTDMFGYHKPSGHVLTSALVECLYCIVSEQQQQRQSATDDKNDNDDPVVLQDTLERAKSSASLLLHRLALTTVGASRACEALGEVLSPTAINYRDGSYGYRVLPPSLDDDDSISGTGQGEPSLLGDFWRTISETAGQKNDLETTACEQLTMAESQGYAPLLSDFSQAVEDPFNDALERLDWDSLLPVLPLGHLG
ncbi:hypothetical protein BJX63DRAFT_389525 [Aspergillus granulosus]|uniref:Zn(2)-C6 fungal-type domain-containing protein n=1 Tax=Aspergillus granulosus TaxID=176169 RepID=A0ABR4HKN0_9EURO